MIEPQPQNTEQDSPDKPIFTQERLFRGEIHVKAPRLREVWQQKTWEPKAEVEMQVKQEPWEGTDQYVVHLSLNVTLKNQGMTAISFEVVQSGVFRLANLTPEQKEYALQAHAPDLLFPAARQAVADGMLQAGLPAFLLAPMHFAALYQQQKEKAKQDNAASNQDEFATQSLFDSENKPVLQ